MKKNHGLGWHLLLVTVLSFLITGFYLQSPGLGDDANYWRLADKANQVGMAVFQDSGFHTMRWPVWIVAYVWQGMFGPGVGSFYAGPFFYMALGGVMAFYIAWRLTHNVLTGWISSVLFLMHPLLNVICFRPMPDLSEGLMIAAAFWFAYECFKTDSVRGGLVYGLCSGLLVGLAHSNRFTGLLTIPLIGVTMLLLIPRKRWLRFIWVLLGVGLFIGVECLVMWNVTGDALKVWHENAGARGRKGTEAIAVWEMPLRFLLPLWKTARMEPFFLLFAVGGSFLWWFRGNRAQRVAVCWFVFLFLGYSCAIQGVNPIRPMLRDSGRFLGSLALPMSVLGASFLVWGGSLLRQRTRVGVLLGTGPWLSWVSVLCLLGVLMAGTERKRFDLDFVFQLRKSLDAFPDGAKIITHRHFIPIARMVNSQKQESFDWIHDLNLFKEDAYPAETGDEEGLMLARKVMWVSWRKALEAGEKIDGSKLPWFLMNAWEKWVLNDVVYGGKTPDYVLFRRRQPQDPAPHVWIEEVPEFLKDAGFTLPWRWEGKKSTHTWKISVKIPEDWRGKKLWMQVLGSSNVPQPFRVMKLTWSDAQGQSLGDEEMTPYFYPELGWDVHALTIPAGAEKLSFRILKREGVIRLELNQIGFYLQ